MTIASRIPKEPHCDAVQIAAEHCLHERSLKRTPAQVIRSVGKTPSIGADWHDAQRILAAAWIEMLIPSTNEDQV